MEMLRPKADGDVCGCADSGRPELTTEQELSRIRDGLRSLQLAGRHAAAMAAWDALPRHVKFDYKWSRWTYRSS